MGGRRGEGQEEGKGEKGGGGEGEEGRARRGRGPLLGPQCIINKAKCYFIFQIVLSNKQKKF